MTSSRDIGFAGLGTMGEPMALNLVRAGTPLTVWNRSGAKCGRLAAAGAIIAADLAGLFDRCDVIILMLADETAIDAVLSRDDGAFEERVGGRILINMATVLPSYSTALEAAIRAAGGCYIEAPVSGSRIPAEAGQLVAMLAGQPEDIARIRPLLTPICGQSVDCGAVPGALLMKLSVNVFLITMVTGLVEATHFARRHNLNVETFVAVVDAGPMASDVSRIKAAKLLACDFSRQAAILDVFKNNQLVVDAAKEARIATPLIDTCLALYRQTEELGHGNEDMVAVIRSIEQLTAAIS